MADLVKLNSLLPAFREKFFHGEVPRFFRQVYKKHELIEARRIGYHPNFHGQPLTNTDLLVHFSQKAQHTRDKVYGSLAFLPKFPGEYAYWLCMDLDNLQAVNAVFDRLIPIYEAYNIDYIWEHGEGGNRGHLWFMCDTPIKILRAFVNQLLDESRIDRTAYDIEIYPCHKDDNVIRLPCGYHVKTSKVYPITYHNETSSNPVFMTESFIAAQSLSKEQILKMLKRDIEPPARKRNPDQVPFIYVPRNLPLP